MSPILGIFASQGRVSTSYESIATVTLSSGASSIDFTSIPNTYKHLQIRGIARNNSTAANDLEGLLIQYNADTGSNYSWHALRGDGATASAAAASAQSYIYSGYHPSNGSTSNTFAAFVIDILDYADTNKYKTQRVLGSVETNNSSNSQVTLFSGNWRSTSAISSIKIYSSGARNFLQYSQFALYGIKG